MRPSGLVRTVLDRLVTRLRLPVRTITDDQGDPYLHRYYVCGRAAPYFPEGTRLRLRWLPFIVYLHHGIRGDRDLALHNHPWKWAVSLILAGGYVEERATVRDVGLQYDQARLLDSPGSVRLLEYRPLSVNLLRERDFHRLSLSGESFWSLFVVGPKLGSWGFLDVWSWTYYNHRRYHRLRTFGPSSVLEDE